MLFVVMLLMAVEGLVKVQLYVKNMLDCFSTTSVSSQHTLNLIVLTFFLHISGLIVFDTLSKKVSILDFSSVIFQNNFI